MANERRFNVNDLTMRLEDTPDSRGRVLGLDSSAVLQHQASTRTSVSIDSSHTDVSML